MKYIYRAFLIFFVLTLSIMGQDASETSCFGCHAMKTLAKKNITNDVIEYFNINRTNFEKSHHGGLECFDCHTDEFAEVPHPIESENFTCLDCHDEDLELDGKLVKNYADDFEKSIHAELWEGEFTCSVCHDPHTMKLRESTYPEILKSFVIENQLCVECHDEKYAVNDSAGRRINLLQSHSQRLKNNQSFFETKCVSCHSANTQFAHEIKPVTVKN